MTVRTLFAAALAALADCAAAEMPFAIDRPAEFDPAKAGWRKVFEDDFDGPEVDWREKWVQPYYDARPRELAETDGEGHLRIKVDFEPGSTNRLRSTSLYTRQAFGCGYYEARVKFTSQNGFWSAFQIGGDANANPFLDGFALDVFEDFCLRIRNPTNELFNCLDHSLHVNGGLGRRKSWDYKSVLPGPADGWHTVGVRWTPLEITCYLDGKAVRAKSAPDNSPWDTVTYDAANHAACAAPVHAVLSGYIMRSRWNEAWQNLAGCEFPACFMVDWVRVWEYPDPPDERPTVSWKAESLGEDAFVAPGATVRVAVDAKPAEKTGAKLTGVHLFSNGFLLQSKTEPPYVFEIPFTDEFLSTTAYARPGRQGEAFRLAGCGMPHELHVYAQDENGRVGRTARTLTRIPLAARSQPHQGEAQRLPGTLNPARFDDGGPNVGYYKHPVATTKARPDLNPRPSRRFRGDEGVSCSEDGTTLDFTTTGEWLNYTVDVASSGSYDVSFPYDVYGTGINEVRFLLDGRPAGSVRLGQREEGRPRLGAQAKTRLELPADRHVITLMPVGPMAIGPVSVSPKKSATAEEWEERGREETQDWFERHWFGRRPVERPADEKIGRRHVELAGGRKKINIDLFLPEGASAANPVAVFVHADHYTLPASAAREAQLLAVATNAVPRRGFAYVHFNLNDVTPNSWNSARDPRSANALLGGAEKPDGWGAVSAWAWGCSRVMDWVETRPELDAKRVAVVGTGCGGKAALWAGCVDRRFALTIANCSGTGGARLLGLPLEGAESVEQMKDRASRLWFCPDWIESCAGRNAEIVRDADDLLKLIAPRLAYVSSASRDTSSGPAGEFESAKRASALWREYGLAGLSLASLPVPGAWDHSGNVGYHLRPGAQALTPWDWQRYMDYMDRHLPGPRQAREMSRATPESQGVSSVAIGRWIEACEKELDALHGFVIVRHGRVIAEGSWKPFDTLTRPHMLYSHSKSFTATAIGFLVDDGKLDLDARVLGLFPDKAPPSPSDNLKALRVRDLLTMNVGADNTNPIAADEGGDWERQFLANALEAEPGTRFRYDSLATYMLSAIVRRVSGKDVIELLRERLFDKIGIGPVASSASPGGVSCGGWGMYMTTRDLARFGQFLLQGGTWNGERLLSAEWVALATGRQTWSGAAGSRSSAAASASDWAQGYGFQFWRCRHGAFRADGAGGQFTIVMPEQDAVVSLQAGVGDMQKELDLVWEHLMPAMGGGVLPENRPAEQTLRECCESLSLPPVAGAREVPDGVLGRDIGFAVNPRGVRFARLDRADGGLTLAFEARAGMCHLPVGLGRWEPGEARIDPEGYETLGGYIGSHPTAASAAVEGDGALHVRVYFTDTPGRMDLFFRQSKEGLVVDGRLDVMRGCDLSGRQK
ncbi:MAG: serine hydrolase [Kiritimatiellae bacterium]|nr:serine hydrolase [Kiritimatiellia bacterium]